MQRSLSKSSSQCLKLSQAHSKTLSLVLMLQLYNKDPASPMRNLDVTTEEILEVFKGLPLKKPPKVDGYTIEIFNHLMGYSAVNNL